MTVLNWLNDSLLFDPKPQPVNHWLNANELIQQNREKEIFLPNSSLLNLYPIMVRRNDFVRLKSSDRVMARFPYIILDEDTRELIENKILLLSEFTRDYFYKSINKTISQWEKIICESLNKDSLPFPVFRCAQALLSVDNRHISNNHISFRSARGEAFLIPTR